MPKPSRIICLWYSRRGGRIASTASSTSQRTSIQLMLARLDSVILRPWSEKTNTPGERFDLPAYSRFDLWSATACLMRTLHKARRDSQTSVLRGPRFRRTRRLWLRLGGRRRLPLLLPLVKLLLLPLFLLRRRSANRRRRPH